ncbi:Galactosyltransferase [Handroanthus impetiginosus]|uniref:Galactosyltransferase n=1 Tax=Handroanthus impetiginosus TaxID=429701 RepID=A0A2G9G3Z9_9LAMI|nr:Galactosyltransferase [Handroanthus impetiginosus]
MSFNASDFFYPLLKTTPFSQPFSTHKTLTNSDSPTNLSHLLFGLVSSEKAWHHRKAYIESWWRPNITRGCLFLDKDPSPELLPWPQTSPPYRVSDDITQLLNKSEIRAQRMVHGIMEVLRELDQENLRWVVMGDDDSIFFVDNIVDVLAKYDHTKYYYLGGHSEFLLSNYLFSFNQAFGGGGIMLSYPLAKALARDMENCLKRYVFLDSADNTTRACIADIGANLSPQKGNHQLDFRGDISGLLSSHPVSPLISLHHFDMLEPIFPFKDRFESTRHLMTAAKADQSRMLQQTICYHRQSNWSFSISWGYSAQIYERIIPRSYLQIPIETFKPWVRTPRPPNYLFNTRKPSWDPCEAPHVFFFESVEKTIERNEILTSYSRAWPRALPACSSSGNHSAEYIQRIQVLSPTTKRTEVDRCECCDVVRMDSVKAEIRVRECMTGEIIA